MPKIFDESASPVSACSGLSGRETPALSRIKAPPPIIAPETIRSRVGPTGLADVRTLGRQMRLSAYGHAWRAIALACGMAWFGPAADLGAATLDSPAALELTGKSAEPFGLDTSPRDWGSVREKWLGV